MNGEGGLSEAEQQFWSLRAGVYAGFESYYGSPSFTPDVDVPLGDIYNIIAAGISAATAVPIPEIFPTVTVGAPSVSAAETSGDSAVLSPVIDPEVDTEVTVYEEEVASRGPVSPRPTDWGEFYDRYVVLNPEVPDDRIPAPVLVPPAPIPLPGSGVEVPPEEEPVTVWTDVLEGVGRAIFPLPAAGIDLYRGYNTPGIVATQMVGPPATVSPTGGGGMAVAQTAATCPPVGPKYAKVCLATGAVMPLRQRRRRRLLTSSDLSDLAALKALFGNSAGVQAALVKAVRR